VTHTRKYSVVSLLLKVLNCLALLPENLLPYLVCQSVRFDNIPALSPRK
jgi:hypothetical protein